MLNRAPLASLLQEHLAGVKSCLHVPLNLDPCLPLSPSECWCALGPWSCMAEQSCLCELPGRGIQGLQGKGLTVRDLVQFWCYQPSSAGALCELSKLCCLHAGVLELWKHIRDPALSIWGPGSFVFLEGDSRAGIPGGRFLHCLCSF